ncbi:hypothetical protein [Actinomadura violacea]|nr:hypothetical protein [Actinomadura violacea]
MRPGERTYTASLGLTGAVPLAFAAPALHLLLTFTGYAALGLAG